MADTPYPSDRGFWLTRDRFDNLISDSVDIWIEKPEPLFYADGDIVWIAPLGIVDRVTTYHGSLPVDEVRKEFGSATPDTERECVLINRGVRGAC